jgi:hypothetical protein
MQDQIDVVWLMHLDVSVADIPLSAPCLSIGRHVVEEGRRVGFEKAFEGNRDAMDEYVTEGKAVGGWKVDPGMWKGEEENRRDGERDQFVLFAPWKGAEQHIGFAETKGFARYSGIREWVSVFDVKHVTVLKIDA